MNWFFIALGAPILWALVNHADKYLLSKYFKGNNVGALVIFSTIVAIVIAPILYIVSPDVFDVSARDISLLIVSGVLYSIAILFYLYALEDGETSVVAPLFQLIPVFSFFLAYILLGEVINGRQALGIIAVIAGSLIISLDPKKKFSVKKKILLYMILASLSIALYEIFFKIAALDVGFAVSSFWQYIGVSLVGVFLFLFIKPYRNQFLKMIKAKPVFMIIFNGASEMVTIVGNLLVNFAVLLAPVVLVLAVTNLQPIFVFLIGIILSLFFPKIGKEDMSRRSIIQKSLSIVIIIFGSYLIY
ncbi:MAG: EamA family transporter [Candidatus Taylorbacteria bacterium]